MRSETPGASSRRALRLRPMAALLVGGWLIAVAAGAATAAPHRAATKSPAHQQPVVVEAAFSHIDYQTDTATFRNIVVVQGDTRVSAARAHATGLSFKNSRWTFEGGVLIRVRPRGTLRADQAVMQIRDNRVTVATVTGHPALFEQQSTDSRGGLHGHANKIVYDVREETARLSGNAWLSNDHNEISGPLLVYNFRHRTVQGASPEGSRRVHITLRQEPPKRSPRGTAVRPAPVRPPKPRPAPPRP